MTIKFQSSKKIRNKPWRVKTCPGWRLLHSLPPGLHCSCDTGVDSLGGEWGTDLDNRCRSDTSASAFDPHREAWRHAYKNVGSKGEWVHASRWNKASDILFLFFLVIIPAKRGEEAAPLFRETLTPAIHQRPAVPSANRGAHFSQIRRLK